MDLCPCFIDGETKTQQGKPSFLNQQVDEKRSTSPSSDSVSRSLHGLTVKVHGAFLKNLVLGHTNASHLQGSRTHNMTLLSPSGSWRGYSLLTVVTEGRQKRFYTLTAFPSLPKRTSPFLVTRPGFLEPLMSSGSPAGTELVNNDEP